MSDPSQDETTLEQRADEQRRRVNDLVSQLDAKRHGHTEGKKSPLPQLLLGLFGVLTAAGFAASRSKKLSKRTREALALASAAAGSATLAVGVSSAVHARAKQHEGKPPIRRVEVKEETQQLPVGITPELASLPLREGPLPKPVQRRAGFWVVISLVVLFVGARLALDTVAGHFAHQAINEGLTGYSGDFSKLHISFIPLSVTVNDLKLVQDGSPDSEALLYVKKVEATSSWLNLITGHVYASAQLDHAAFRVMVGKTVAPPEAKEAAKEAAKQVKENNVDLSAVLEKIIPFRVDRIELKDSEVTIVDATEPKRPHFWVSDIELVLENLVSREHLDQDAPLMLTARATVQKTGVLKLLFVADLLDKKPGFTGQAQLSGLKLESLYAWAAAKAGVSPHGTLNVFVNADSGGGALNGDVKVLARDVHVDGLDNVGDKLKAAAANVAIRVLSDKSENRTVGTILPLRGSLQNPDPQIWPTILGVLRNAFVDSLNWGFGDLPKPTSDKKEGVIEQAVKGLDKKEGAPKAQPTGDQKKGDDAKKTEDDKKKPDDAKKTEDEKKKAEEAKKAEDEKKKGDDAKKAEDEKKKADEAKKAEDAKKKADEAKKAEDEKKKADDAKKKAEEQKKADEAKKQGEKK